jgi:acetyl-CoA acetyltransferase
MTLPGTASPEAAKNYLVLGERLGINPRFTGSLVMGGATAGACVELAAMAVQNGMAKVVACIFADTARTAGNKFGAAAGGEDTWAVWGMLGNAANSALGMRRHMALYGTRSDQLGWIAVTCRRHAAMNPNAVMREPITLEDHQKSRLIVDPLHMLDCCLISDGAVCILVTSPERARDCRKKPVAILGMGQGHTMENLRTRDWWYLPHQAQCIAAAYKMAGVGAADIDVAQLYDNFTVAVLFWLEHAGFCKTGEAGPYVEGGTRIALGGDGVPINTAGGNLSESYMQGWLHMVEGVRQVRGECGPRQVTDAEICLVTGRGMTLNTASAMILGQ